MLLVVFIAKVSRKDQHQIGSSDCCCGRFITCQIRKGEHIGQHSAVFYVGSSEAIVSGMDWRGQVWGAGIANNRSMELGESSRFQPRLDNLCWLWQKERNGAGCCYACKLLAC